MTEEQMAQIKAAMENVVPFAKRKRMMPWQYTIWHPGCSDELEAYVEWAEARNVSAEELTYTMLTAIWERLNRDRINLDEKTGKKIEAEVSRRSAGIIK
jgi:hypothetical protein